MFLNLGSAQQLSLVLFGGIIKKEQDIPIINELGQQILFKTGSKRGKVKTKKQKIDIKIKGMGVKPLREWETKKNGIYQTNDKILKLLSKKENTDAGMLAKIMLEIRELEKMVGTYYEGFENKIHKDGLLHGNINHVSTDTGRTSSNKPNIQNIP